MTSMGIDLNNNPAKEAEKKHSEIFRSQSELTLSTQ